MKELETRYACEHGESLGPALALDKRWRRYLTSKKSNEKKMVPARGSRKWIRSKEASMERRDRGDFGGNLSP